MLLNKYDPRLKKYDELAKTFVTGEEILEEILEDLQPSKKQKLTRQSWIITGSRGAGKSHLISLLYREINNNKKLKKHWLPLIFPEEIFKVDSLYRLLISIFENLFKNIDSGKIEDLKEKFEEIKKIRLKGSLKQKNEQKLKLAKEFLELMLLVRDRENKKFIFMLENLQHLFHEQLSEKDQELLRGFFNENPETFIIIGSALTVFQDIEHYGKPFYHFFRIRNMETLDKKGILRFLRKVSVFRGDGGIDEKIESNRHYIYTYNIFTGGNPRLVLFLYELLIGKDELSTEVILEKVSELTPYFRDKTREESAQRKLILDALVWGSPAQTATEIAEEINEEQKSITEQLKRLTAEGWIKEIPIQAEGVKQKEVFYTLRDYFYRIWYQLRTGNIDESEIYCMAELAVLLFDKREIEERRQKCESCSDYNLTMYEKASELARNEAYMANINLLVESSKKSENEEIQKIFDEIKKCYETGRWEDLLKSANLLLQYPYERGNAYFYQGLVYHKLEKASNAVECYEKAIEIKPDKDEAWYNMGNSYFDLKEYEKAIKCYEKTIEIKPDADLAWYNMGLSYSYLKEYEKAIECYEKAVEIKPDDDLAWGNMGNRYSDLKEYGKSIKCYEKAIEIKPDEYSARYNMGNSYFKLKDYKNAYSSFSGYLKITPACHLEPFLNFSIYVDVAVNLFKSPEELQILLSEKSSVEIKLESLIRLILLGKHVAVTDMLYELLEKKELPAPEIKKLDFFLQGYIFHLFEKGESNGELKALLESWVRLVARVCEKDHDKATRKFLEFFLISVKIAGKEKVSLNVIQSVMEGLDKKGIEVSEIILKILSALQNPNSREARKYMADPLFKEIVAMLG